MKNVMVYFSCDEEPKCNKELLAMFKVQVENSKKLGWSVEDIIVLTNFEMEYGGVKTIKYEGPIFKGRKKAKCSNKIKGLEYILDNISNSNLFFHDFDSYQNYPFFKMPEQCEGYDIGIAQYGRNVSNPYYNTGCMFVRPSSKDILSEVMNYCIKNNINEEKAFEALYPPNDTGRVKVLDRSYNIGKHRTIRKYTKCPQPPKMLHFHYSRYEYYCTNKNQLQKPLANEYICEYMEKYIKPLLLKSET